MPKYETEAAQNKDEIRWFANLLARENVTNYLEIGSRYGGSVWPVARALRRGSCITTVDMPSGYGARIDGKEVLESCLSELGKLGYATLAIWGDSTDPAVVEDVRLLGPFDAVFIDANHTLPYVTKDWANYGPMARIVAFHDINWKRAQARNAIEVPGFWNSIKRDYRHEEIRLDTQDNGIGVLWRA